jgi:hypothetical protein
MYSIRNHHRKQTLTCNILGRNRIPQYRPNVKYCRRYRTTTLKFVDDNVDIRHGRSLQYSNYQVTGVAYGVHKIEVCNTSHFITVNELYALLLIIIQYIIICSHTISLLYL